MSFLEEKLKKMRTEIDALKKRIKRRIRIKLKNFEKYYETSYYLSRF